MGTENSMNSSPARTLGRQLLIESILRLRDYAPAPSEFRRFLETLTDEQLTAEYELSFQESGGETTDHDFARERVFKSTTPVAPRTGAAPQHSTSSQTAALAGVLFSLSQRLCLLPGRGAVSRASRTTGLGARALAGQAPGRVLAGDRQRILYPTAVAGEMLVSPPNIPHLTVICSWCHAELGTKPCTKEQHGQVSHSICPQCKQRESSRLPPRARFE